VDHLADDDIWQRVLSGESEAFGMIWDRHRDRIFRSLLAERHAPVDAEDLTATVFLELWRHRATVRFVDRSLLPWLLVTAHNVGRNADRARRRHRQFLASLPRPADVADHAETFADRNDERTTELRAAIARCGKADAALLALTALEGFTIREAGAALGLSESAAKMRLSRLRVNLRADLPGRTMEEGA
jgi:RNA polymerase sigma factor (sigma-70 family)